MLPVPRRWSDLDPAWMTAALARRYPGIVVEGLRVGDVRHGTNTSARVALSLEREEGPSSVFVKVPGRATHRLALVALGALATEARLADGAVRFPLEHPAFLAGGVDRWRAACVVVTEDIVASGATPFDARTPLSVDAVGRGLEGLAALHAAHWARPLPAALGCLSEWRLGPGLRALSVASLARGMRRAHRVLGRGLRLPRGVGPRQLSHQFARSSVLAAAPPRTVLHGDPHPGNCYGAVGGETGFFDWQLARVGHWSHDVGYFLVGSLDVEDRRRHERGLLARYLDALGRAGAAPPPFGSAWERYRETPAFGLATWLHTLSFGTLQRVDVCMATVERFAAAYGDLGTARTDVAAR
ncbi:MAG: phosphotransferase [Actinomycetota bacterium]|nr:phosphotransferase [Actinomycetota bacterium]